MQALDGGLAQLGEHLLCKQGVVGSIPSSSTTHQAKSAKRLQSEQMSSALKRAIDWIARFSDSRESAVVL
jgi:hypothetical protein